MFALPIHKPMTSDNDNYLELTTFSNPKTTSAILIHEIKVDKNVSHFLTEHTVTNGVVGSPRNVSIAGVINYLSKSLSPTQKGGRGGRKLLDPRLLYQGENEILFYERAKTYQMVFLSKSGCKKPMTIPMPAHLMFYTHSKLYCFALNSDKRPSESTELFVSPIPNLFAGHTLCFGSNKHPSTKRDTVMQELIDIAFCSVSNGTHIAQPLQGVPASELNSYLESTKNNPDFDGSLLIPAHRTLQQLMEV